MKTLRYSAAVLAFPTLPLAAASIQGAKPEELGFSSERLARIQQAVERHIDAHDIAGAVTLVARRGRIAQFEAYGLADLDSRKPMSKDSLFWIASMSKPITGVAILMLVEEGKVRLTDPVSKFIPEFRGLKVAMLQESAGPPAAGSASGPSQYIRCRRTEKSPSATCCLVRHSPHLHSPARRSPAGLPAWNPPEL
jgi:CubicO group peptidase (beta-lactamase class C family)